MILTLFGAALVVGCSAGAPAPDAPDTSPADANADAQALEPGEDVSAVLENRTRAILEGIVKDDMSEVLALYADGAVYSPDGETLLEDAGALTEYWNAIAQSPAADGTLEVVDIIWLAPDAFVEIQRYEVLDGEGARMLGGYAMILWRKIEGEWRMSADVSNS
jgi:hypothetical protein